MCMLVKLSSDIIMYVQTQLIMLFLVHKLLESKFKHAHMCLKYVQCMYVLS